MIVGDVPGDLLPVDRREESLGPLRVLVGGELHDAFVADVVQHEAMITFEHRSFGKQNSLAIGMAKFSRRVGSTLSEERVGELARSV